MDVNEYTDASATDIAARVLAGEVSARGVIDAAIAHIEATEPTANAFIHVDEVAARHAADQVDASIAAGRNPGPLAGVPVSVKDLVHVDGMATSSGSKLFAGTMAPGDAVPVARLRNAGAVIVGKTTTPEFGHKPVTSSPLFGETLNPWNPSFTCGGSSGGAAVSLATRQVPLAIGTDGGGSIRIPASVCGVYGLKATLGRVPHVHAPDLFANNSYIGPMARSVDDLELMLSVMAGVAAGDPWARHEPGAFLQPPGKLRIGYARLVGNPTIEPEVSTAFDRCIEVIETLDSESLKFETQPISLDLASLEPAFRSHLEATLAGRFGDRLDTDDRDLLDESFIRTLENGRRRTIGDVVSANIERSNMYREVESLFGRVDLLLTPTLAAASVPHGIDTHDNIIIDGVDCGPIRAGWYPYTFPFNLTGHPALSMPCGWASNGLPIGLQIVGPWNSEQLMLEVARLIAEGLGIGELPATGAASA